MPGEHQLSRNSPRGSNRLAAEDSLYLRQHAHNPVDWFPWSEEAFGEAARLDRPVFLSIGYSSCHWCHVMERESFADEDVAALLNADFVAVKVDREERLAWGLLELYEAGFDLRYLEAARMLAGRAVSSFWDEAGGGFFFAPDTLASEIPLRKKESYDGAVPSGNAAMMFVLLRLARLTGDPGLEERAARTGAAFRAAISRAPAAHAFWMCALDLAVGPSVEIVIAGRRGGPDTEALLAVVRGAYLPRAVVLFKDPDAAEEGKRLAALAPFSAAMNPVNGRASAYLCSASACGPPVTGPEDLRALLVTRSRTI
jgi:uncharacterized protein YyaL (SSP411 family)